MFYDEARTSGEPGGEGESWDPTKEVENGRRRAANSGRGALLNIMTETPSGRLCDDDDDVE